MNNKILTIINFGIIIFFILIWLIGFYKIDAVLIGVFRELLTLPFMILQIVFLGIGINRLTKKNINFITKLSIISLAICAIISIGSFF